MADKTLTLPVTGMTCANCVATVERNVRKLDGVREANVNFASEKISLVYDDSLLGTADIVARIRKAGYDVPEQTLDLAITGMDCVNCAANVERALKKVEGVEAASVNLATERATVAYDPATTTPQALIEKIQEVGYTPVV
ncbi:MAG: heavy metal-associated domain-containing protein, partial [Anaerolineae bacterium]